MVSKIARRRVITVLTAAPLNTGIPRLGHRTAFHEADDPHHVESHIDCDDDKPQEPAHPAIDQKAKESEAERRLAQLCRGQGPGMSAGDRSALMQSPCTDRAGVDIVLTERAKIENIPTNTV